MRLQLLQRSLRPRTASCGAAVLSATSAALHRGVVDGVAGIGVWAGVGVVVSARRCAWSLRGVGAAVVGAPGYWCGGRLVVGWRRGALADSPAVQFTAWPISA